MADHFSTINGNLSPKTWTQVTKIPLEESRVKKNLETFKSKQPRFEPFPDLSHQVWDPCLLFLGVLNSSVELTRVNSNAFNLKTPDSGIRGVTPESLDLS